MIEGQASDNGAACLYQGQHGAEQLSQAGNGDGVVTGIQM